jgi:hypothetical protein
MLSTSARPASRGDDARVQALVTTALFLGREPQKVETSIKEVLDCCDGDVELLVAAKDQLLESMIAGAAPHDAKTGMFILRCAALQGLDAVSE